MTGEDAIPRADMNTTLHEYAGNAGGEGTIHPICASGTEAKRQQLIEKINAMQRVSDGLAANWGTRLSEPQPMELNDKIDKGIRLSSQFALPQQVQMRWL